MLFVSTQPIAGYHVIHLTSIATKEWHRYPKFFRNTVISPSSTLTVILPFPSLVYHPPSSSPSFYINTTFYTRLTSLLAFKGMTTEDWHLYLELLRSTAIVSPDLPTILHLLPLDYHPGGGTHIGKGYGDVPWSWPPFFRPVAAP